MAARAHNTGMNPAASAEQYRLAQAVLGGTARDARMPVSVAREIVDRTPAKLRSEYSQYTVNPVGFTGLLYSNRFSKADKKYPGRHTIIAHQSGFASRESAADWAHKEAEIRNVPHNIGTMSERDMARYGSMEAFAKHRGYKLNPFYGADLDLETSMAPAWKYYDSKQARDMDARLKEGERKKVVVGHSMFGFKEGGGKKWRMRLADHRGNPKKRPMDVDGNPVPQNYEMLSIRRNQGDALDVKKSLALQNISAVIVEPPTTTFGTSTGNWSVWTPRKTYKRAVKLAEKAYFDRYPERMGNPQPAADEMYSSFHGEQPDETIEFQDEEHYHSHLAALGELVEMKVKLVGGGRAVIGFDSVGEESEVKTNPFWPFNSFTHSTIYHVGTGEKYKKSGSYKGYTLYQKLDTGEFLVPALDKESRFDTKKDVTQFVDSWAKHRKNPGGPLDEHAAKELELYVENDRDLYRQQYTPINKNLVTKMVRGVYNHAGAVKLFGYLMESGAKKYAKEYSEGKDWHQIFSPATRKHVADIYARHFETEAELGNYDSLLPKKYAGWRKKNPGPFREAGKLLGRGTRAVQRPVDQFLGAAGKVGGYLDDQLGRAVNPDTDHPTGPVYLTSNESGTQLYLTGGDQSLDLPALGITGHEADKEIVYIGHVTNICYHAHKIFNGKREEYDYVHKMGEEGGELPVLNYDRINKRLQLSGGSYVINRPLGETSPGIEN